MRKFFFNLFLAVLNRYNHTETYIYPVYADKETLDLGQKHKDIGYFLIYSCLHFKIPL